MAIEITACFRNTGMVQQAWGWSARERWLVTGTGDKDEALALIAPVGTRHPDNTNLRLKHKSAESAGLLAWNVVADFVFGDVGLGSGNPLLEPPRIRYEKVRETAPIDKDFNNVAVVDSAGQPIDPQITETIPIKALIVRKAQPFFNVSLSIQYEDSVNSDTFSIQGAGSLKAGQAYCDSIEPTEEYTNLAPYVWVEYRFLLAGGDNPFMAHPIDQGLVGWYTDPAGGNWMGPFCLSTGNAKAAGAVATFPIRLDGTGKPIDARWFVSSPGGTAYTPIANPNPPAGLRTEPSLTSATITTLLYINKNKQAFSGLI